MLAAAAREVGGVQIQNRGTLGGNVANASPAGDTLPVLAAADAIVVLRSAAGTRARAVHRVLHRLSPVGAAAGRADRRLRDSRDPRPAVVPEGRHPRRAGDFQDRDGRRGPFDRLRAGGRRREDRPRQRRADGHPRAAEPRRRSPAARRSRTRSASLAAGDRADRRHPIDRRVSPARRVEPAGAVLDRHAIAGRILRPFVLPE